MSDAGSNVYSNLKRFWQGISTGFSESQFISILNKSFEL